MIKTFGDRETERLFLTAESKRLGAIARRAWQKLRMIDAANALSDLATVPGNRLESLGGNRKGQHSIRINDQFRICFTWRDGDAYVVEVTDYHR